MVKVRYVEAAVALDAQTTLYLPSPSRRYHQKELRMRKTSQILNLTKGCLLPEDRRKGFDRR